MNAGQFLAVRGLRFWPSLHFKKLQGWYLEARLAHFLGWDPCNSSHGLQARTRRISPALIGFAFLGEEHFMHRALIAFGLSLAVPTLAFCQTSHRVAIRAGHLIDGTSDKPLENALIVIEGDKIISVAAGGSAPAGVEVIDLSKATVLPGFIDTHTHVLLQGDITAEEYDAQLLKQSIPYRAILAARNAHIALSHGFTAIRDLQTEGALYADE